MKDKLMQIINHYGVEKQLKYIHSEYYELDEAIINYQSSGFDFNYDKEARDIEKEYIHHIAEELADVMVMLKQFQYYYGIEDEQIKKIMESKIERQLERIEREKNNV
jgi:NTP pyrophosphatase (non-canonical NTP hydrolase)